ncbi:S-layer homology domain-containing protein [Paenibacillus macerans]|uniref:S-layer homology domain-containing protein n=1 Tax=Paenibacillus macerans TaxID=44252 RepID=UPI000EDBBB26|nr:S-layer homology domain-containing protein [Paenibacillus macerans]GBK65162.1 S-layer homology domain-containing protein [Paenibacillus macerans]GBK71459.1 S-layer homology domain-containing protein [Paenibacillus macerans]
MKKWLSFLLAGTLISAFIPFGSHTAVGTVNAAAITFKDVKYDHWAKKAIDSAVAKGYFKGYADGTFKPNATVTRAEFAALLARAAKGDAAETTSSGHEFSDLTGHWSEAEVERAVSLGYIQPGDYPNGFKPNTPITRFEMSKWMTSGLAAAAEDYKQALEDTKTTVIPVKEYFNPGIPQTKSSYIAVALGTKLMSGYPDGSFGLDKNATRAEASTILLNLERVDGQKADDFLGLKELRQVGTERTNLETISPFTTGNTSLNDVAEKTLTFRNNAGSLKLHNYIVVDTEDFKNIKSIYAPLFVDETDYISRLDKPGVYRAYIQITIYPKTKEFDLDHYMTGVGDGVVRGSRILNQNLMQKYGYFTLPHMNAKEFFKGNNNGNGITVWVQRFLDSETMGSQITTDDGSFASINNK